MALYPDFRSLIQSGSGNENYLPSDESTASATKYYGLVTRTGAWIIVEQDTTAETYRYVVGSEDYQTSWTAKTTNSYKYFFNLP